MRSISVSGKSRRRGPSWKLEPLVYDPVEIARAGVFVSTDAEAVLSFDRSYVRPEDEAPAVVEPENEVQSGGESDDESRANGSIQRAVVTVGGSQVEPVDQDEDDTIKPLLDRLVTELPLVARWHCATHSQTIRKSPSKQRSIISCWRRSIASRRRAAASRSQFARRHSRRTQGERFGRSHRHQVRWVESPPAQG
jgi:hypothetical protein